MRFFTDYDISVTQIIILPLLFNLADVVNTFIPILNKSSTDEDNSEHNLIEMDSVYISQERKSLFFNLSINLVTLIILLWFGLNENYNALTDQFSITRTTQTPKFKLI